MTSLSNRALLVSLNISQWTARKYDRTESQAIASKHNINADIARVNKSLLPMSHELDAIHKLTGAIRTDYYKYSLPWQDGMQIIKSEGYMKFTAMIADHKCKWDDAVTKFLDCYEDSINDARHLLGTLFKDEDYPSLSVVREKFKMDVAFTPVPSANDWRVELSDTEVNALRKQIEERVSDSQSKAMQEAWQRVYDVVSKAHERLANPDAIFRDTLVENAVELCSLLPSLNLADDPHLEQMRQEIEGSLCAHTPEQLRVSPLAREQVAAKMADIMSKMGGMYGPA